MAAPCVTGVRSSLRKPLCFQIFPCIWHTVHAHCESMHIFNRLYSANLLAAVKSFSFCKLCWAWLGKLDCLDCGKCIIWQQLYDWVSCVVACHVSEAGPIYTPREICSYWLIMHIFTWFQKHICGLKAVMWRSMHRYHHLCCGINCIATLDVQLLLIAQLQNLACVSTNLGLVRRAWIWWDVYRMVGCPMVTVEAFWKAKTLLLQVSGNREADQPLFWYIPGGNCCWSC